MNIKGLYFVCTCCNAFLEQYDVYDSEGEKVGYVHLRYGELICDYPDVLEETIYTASIGNDWTGCFESDDQRIEHLNNIADKILEKINAER